MSTRSLGAYASANWLTVRRNWLYTSYNAISYLLWDPGLLSNLALIAYWHLTAHPSPRCRPRTPRQKCVRPPPGSPALPRHEGDELLSDLIVTGRAEVVSGICPHAVPVRPSGLPRCSASRRWVGPTTRHRQHRDAKQHGENHHQSFIGSSIHTASPVLVMSLSTFP